MKQFIESMQEKCFNTAVVEHLYNEILVCSEKCRERAELREDVIYSHEYRMMHNSFLELTGFIYCAYSMLHISNEEKDRILNELRKTVSVFDERKKKGEKAKC